MNRSNYLDFDLQIQSVGAGFRSHVVRSPAGEATGHFSSILSETELENYLLKLGRPRRSTRRGGSPESVAGRELGERLFEAAFGPEVRSCLRQSLELARGQNAGLRIRLRLKEAPELNNLPWEYLYDKALNRFFALSNETPLVRYLDLAESIRPLIVELPLRVLVMISSPTDYPQLDSQREWDLLSKALSPMERQGRLVLDRLEDATLDNLRKRLRKEEHHVFHFIGHGQFAREHDSGVLVLEHKNKHGRKTTGDELGVLLHDYRSLRLAVLNACEGARASASDPFSGVAQTLVQQGIPAVIAMQFEITDEAAITFAREFYDAIADGLPVDAVMAETRKAIYTDGDGLEWGTPVLYMRSPDGMIFQTRGAQSRHEHADSGEKDFPAETSAVLPRQHEYDTSQPSMVMVRSLKGHTQSISRIAVTRDGKTLASGCSRIIFDPELWIWDIGTGEIRTKLAGHTTSVHAVAFSPDGTILASGATDQALRLWSMPDGKPLHRLQVPADCAILSVAFSPNGATLAVGTNEPLVRLWRPADGKVLRILGDHECTVTGLAFSPDGTLLASISTDHVVRLWRVNDWESRAFGGQIQQTDLVSLPRVAFSPECALLAHGAQVSRVSDWKPLWTLQADNFSPDILAGFSPDGALLATASFFVVQVWRVADGKLLCKLEDVGSGSVQDLAWLPDGSLLVARGKMIHLWSWLRR